MHREEETNSITASFSDFCSVGERSQGNRQQLLIRENTRLRKEHSEISQKYIKMCNDLSKIQSKAMQKEKKLMELDLFYRKEIEELKRELTIKNSQLIKIQKSRTKKSGQQNKENRNQNEKAEQFEEILENQSMVLSQVQNENVKLYQLACRSLQLFKSFEGSKQCLQMQKRIAQIRRELEQKPNMESVIERSNCMLEELRSKGHENGGHLKQKLINLKNKRDQLKNTPITFDYDLEAESRGLQVLLTDIDIQMRLIKPKKNQQ